MGQLRLFRLAKSLYVIEDRGGVEIQFMVPAGEVVELLRGPFGSRIHMLEIRWRDRPLLVFQVDFEESGAELCTEADSDRV